MQHTSRLASIDCYRGFAVMMLVMGSHLFAVEALPPWLQHAPDGRLTFPDLGAPWFVFAIGLTYGPSLRRRWTRDGPAKTTWHFLRRCLILFAIGFVMAFGQNLVGLDAGRAAGPGFVYWGVLQALAVAILLTMPALLLPALPRALVGLALLAAYQTLLVRYWLPSVLASPHGGPAGALGWTSLLILCTACADLYSASYSSLAPQRTSWIGGFSRSLASIPRPAEASIPRSRLVLFPASGIIAIAAGVALSPLVPISKLRISASYVLVTLGGAVLLFWLFHLMTEHLGWRLPGWEAWGKNPLVLYVLHGFLVALLLLPSAPWWHAQASFGLAAVQSFVLIGALTVVAYTMERRGWIISL